MMYLQIFCFWTLLTMILAWIFKYLLWRLPRRLPPGPWGLPFLGYSPFLSNAPYKDYIRLKEKYGNIFGMRFGMQYVIVLNDFSDIKEVFNKEGLEDRPPDWFKFSEESDNLLNMSGKTWKETRKFTSTTFRKLGFGKNKVEQVIKEEISSLTESLRRKGPQTEVNFLESSYVHFLNIILTIICGKTYEDSDKLLENAAVYFHDFGKAIVFSQYRLLYPLLRPYLWIKKVMKLDKRKSLEGIEYFLRKEIEKHEKEYDENNLEDFISYYLKEMKMKSIIQETSINRRNLMGNSETILIGGTDTSMLTTTWVLLYLVRYQEAQQMIYEEIVTRIGRERCPSCEDRDELPYTNAFIAETARFQTILPAEDPRWSNKEETIRGYTIPKGTVIFANVHAVHMDKNLWSDPENFRPERFLSSDGKQVLIPEYWIPFLIGRRTCPGAKLANMQVFLFVTSLVQRFQLVAPKTGLSLKSKVFFVNCPLKAVLYFKEREMVDM